MKLTYGEAFQSLGILGTLKESGKLGFAIAKNARKISEELVEYNAKRDELIQKYGNDLGEGRFGFTPDKAAEFNKEIRQYDEMDFEVTPTTVTEDEFTKGSLTSDQMYQLMWMVDE